MNKLIPILITIISLSFIKNESPVAISQSKALLTADVIFEGEVIRLENNEARIKIITPIWSDLKNSDFLKRAEITIPFDYKTDYSLRGQIPGLNEKAIFVFKINSQTKKVKHFFRDWYITKLENKATQYYIWGRYSKTVREYTSSEDIINSIKILRKSYQKNIDLFQETIPIKSKVSLSDIEKAKEKNKAVKVWIEDIEAYNKLMKE